MLPNQQNNKSFEFLCSIKEKDAKSGRYISAWKVKKSTICNFFKVYLPSHI